MNIIGLLGAQSTGKTTLGREYAKRNKIEFVETSVKSVWRNVGLSPLDPLPFKTRLMVQELILTHLCSVYDSITTDVIVDRTPLDLAAYTMAEVLSHTVAEEDQEVFARYIQRCIDLTNRKISTVILVQPGVPFVMEELRGSGNRAYIEHVSSLMMGLMVDERVKSQHFYLPRAMLDLDERSKAVEYADHQTRKRWRAELEGQTAH